MESLTSLSDKGLIVFVQNRECPQSSWVVAETESLLREVNGTLFAPKNFKQYRDIASNCISFLQLYRKVLPQRKQK